MLYELTYLISPELDEIKLQELSKNIEKIITEKSKNVRVETLRKISLSYPVEKQTQAFLGSIRFEAKTQDIKEMQKKIEKMPEILRYLLIHKSYPKPKEKSGVKEGLKQKLFKTDKPSEKEIKQKQEPKIDMEEIEKELAKVLE